jgi:hypothetical protein
MSSGCAKVAPVALGFFLAKLWGHGEYASFILLASFSAFLSALPTLGSVPQILASGSLENRDSLIKKNIAVSLVINLALQILYWGYWYFSQRYGSEVDYIKDWGWLLSVSFYSTGLVLYGLANACLSSKERWMMASGWSVFVYFFSVVVVLLVGVSAGFDGARVLIVYSLVFFALSFLYFIRVYAFLGFDFAGLAMKKSGRWFDFARHLKVSFFGVAYLWGFYLVAERVNSQASELMAAIYSLSFQLFSLSIFVPSVLGSILVPYLSNRSNEKKTGGRLYPVLYALLPAMFGLLIYLFSEQIVLLYGFERHGEVALEILMSMQLAAVLASLSAYKIQGFIVGLRYWSLFFGGIVWLGVLGLGVDAADTVLDISGALIFSYLSVVVFYYSWPVVEKRFFPVLKGGG